MITQADSWFVERFQYIKVSLFHVQIQECSVNIIAKYLQTQTIIGANSVSVELKQNN